MRKRSVAFDAAYVEGGGCDVIHLDSTELGSPFCRQRLTSIRHVDVCLVASREMLQESSFSSIRACATARRGTPAPDLMAIQG